MRRAKEEVTGWEVSDPPHVGICWSNDGQLYAIDKDANLYSVSIYTRKTQIRYASNNMKWYG